MKMLLLLILAITLSACSLFEEKPNNAVGFTSDQIVVMAIQVEQAQSRGLISEETGDEYLTMLLKANDLLRGTTETFNDIEICKASEHKFQCIDSILTVIEESL
jgi:uncharacterized protein YdbL (DUF1318 family)